MRFVAHATKVWESPCRAGPSLPKCRTRMMDYEGKKEEKKANSQTMLKCLADAVRVTWMLRMTTGSRLMYLIFPHRNVLETRGLCLWYLGRFVQIVILFLEFLEFSMRSMELAFGESESVPLISGSPTFKSEEVNYILYEDLY